MRQNSPFTARLARVLVVALLLAPTLVWAGRSLVRVPLKGTHVFERLQRQGAEILAVGKDGMIDALVDDEHLDDVLSMGIPVSVIPAGDIALARAALDANLGLYHTFAEMESLITTWESDFPGICDVSTIGSSVEGRPIYAIKISDNVSVDETGETEVLFMGNHHAREIMSVEIPLLFAQYLLVGYGSDPTITSHVDSKEIFFVPMVNPDGHVYVENNHTGGSGTWWRKNRRVNYDMSIGVDLNRNYGFEFAYDDIGSSGTPSSALYRGTGPFSEPETQAIRTFVNGREFTMWLSYHSYGELLLYPWGYVPANTPDHRYYKRLGELLSEYNGYLAGNYASGAIYPVNGDSDDWGYGEQVSKGKIFAFTPEVNSYGQGGFGPADSLIAPTFQLNLEMNLRVLAYCENPYAVTGPFRPTMYAISDPYYPVYTLSWSGNVAGDPNTALDYQLERCTDPFFVTDEAEAASPDWQFDGFTVSATAYTGSGGYYSGMGDNMNHSIVTDRPYLVDAQSDTFSFYTSYSIETDYDYAYVEVSDDYGETWSTIPGNITTTYNPYGANRGYGITGSTVGWTEAIFPLTAFLGQEILLKISYVTDTYVTGHGIDVDVLGPVPTCAGVDVVATGSTDTTLQVIPDQVGTYRYRIQGMDAESDGSGWSNSRTIAITTLTGASTPLSYHSRLEPNHPNPFNPVTHIPYTVGGSARDGAARSVTLRIYDVIGRLVATLVDETKAPGRYEATWNASDRNGLQLPSGVYFSRLVVGGTQVFTQKLVLLK
jgi:hypothetical protein